MHRRARCWSFRPYHSSHTQGAPASMLIPITVTSKQWREWGGGSGDSVLLIGGSVFKGENLCYVHNHSGCAPVYWCMGCTHVAWCAGELLQLSSKAKWAFRVNPCLLSSNKCRPYLFIYITPWGRQERAVLVCYLLWIMRKAVKREASSWMQGTSSFQISHKARVLV